MSKFKENKETLKNLAKEIRVTRKTHKESMRERCVGLDSKLIKLRREFRRLHIAMCLSSGTSYEKIESPSNEHALTKADNIFIQKILEELINERNADSVLEN